MDRNSAITAMTFADPVGEPGLDEEHQLWPAIQSWSTELVLTGPDALTRPAQPPAPGQPESPGWQPDREAAD
jgi:hypothetical protein